MLSSTWKLFQLGQVVGCERELQITQFSICADLTCGFKEFNLLATVLGFWASPPPEILESFMSVEVIGLLKI
ncbi:hypothetical protein [Pseudovibrio sp. Tun.PSC04-5.I4]|uniref:hypothetical protein n=1 Tax=Pseudovibrio sp. Tun.PSC04-5.I4 TaxID=1798213 RepID=UPI00088B918A|nr:hypothetical protein [Pseudovibrio sp. Tun.PSC04-5.I4]SDR13487.1 hypothetical protein SAMN04515695_2946 [Pseudovibrio sp. Tun.PSC04-5.I4]